MFDQAEISPSHGHFFSQ